MHPGSDENQFKQVLSKHHAWPCIYMFKFVVPQQSEAGLRALFPAAEITRRISTRGRFVSLSAMQTVSCADDVVDMYRAAAEIENIVIL